MVKVIGPVMSLGGFQPLRKPRTIYPPEPPPPPIEKVDVTAGDPAPEPDCTGTYERIEDYEEHACYKRTTEPYFFLWWATLEEVWVISNTPGDTIEGAWWRNESLNGEYEPDELLFFGMPIASEPYF